MPDGMPGSFVKGVIGKQVSDLLNDRTNRATVLNLINQGETSVVDLLANLSDFPRNLREHLDAHVFRDKPPAFWPTCEHKDRIVLRGVRKAIVLAQERDFDLDCYWVCSGHRFQVVVTRSEHQVSIFFLTPPMPANWAPAATPEDDEVWHVVDDAGGRELEALGRFEVGDDEGRPVRARLPCEMPVLEDEIYESGDRIVAVYRGKRGCYVS